MYVLFWSWSRLFSQNGTSAVTARLRGGRKYRAEDRKKSMNDDLYKVDERGLPAWKKCPECGSKKLRKYPNEYYADEWIISCDSCWMFHKYDLSPKPQFPSLGFFFSWLGRLFEQRIDCCIVPEGVRLRGGGKYRVIDFSTEE